ncbi:MAG TPA: acyltransferase [Gammaproteobacteria bacterium]|nr:acyltransferase [Gammaproteobacteria bacterium]
MNRSPFISCVIQSDFTDVCEKNWQGIESLLEQAADNNASLVVLPELHNGHYFCQHESSHEFDRAEPVPGPTTDWLSKLAARLDMVIVGSVFERRAAGLYHNTAVVLDSDGTLAGSYRKMQIPDDPGYFEKYYFTPGDSSFRPIPTSLGTLGVMVCWDQWFPEAARLMALAGADVLIYPTAIGWDSEDDAAEQQRQLDSWMTVQRGHAICNGIPLLAANRTGHEPDPAGQTQGIQFWGHSFICGPQGEVLAAANDNSTCCILAEIDPGHIEEVRRSWPFFRDRRIDAYDDLTKRWNDVQQGENDE